MDDHLERAQEEGVTGFLTVASHSHTPLSRQNLVMVGTQADSRLTYLSRLGDALQNDPYFIAIEDPMTRTYLSHIIRDLETTRVYDIAFRDESLARRLFPETEIAVYH